MPRQLLLLALLLLAAISIPPAAAAAPAAEYHVAPPPTGSDSQIGSQSAPWATLQHAVDSVDPGDRILVHSGAYLGARIEISGVPSAWITLQAAPGESVLINAPGPANVHQSNLEIETWEGDGVVAYWVIEGFEVSGAPGWGIDIRGNDTAKSHHITIRKNKVHHNGLAAHRTGIFAAFTDDILVENNQSYNNGEHGIYINNSSDRFTVRGNQLHDNNFCGLHTNGDASMGGDGVMSDGLIENNIIYANGAGGGAAINMDGVTHTLIRNNLLYDNHATGVAIFQQDGAVCSQYNRLLHNTIRVASNGRWAVLVGDPACVGNQIYNNILLNEHSYRGAINLANGVPAGFESDYNVVISRFTTNDGDSILTLSQWQALGFDAHSLVSTPAALFVDPGAAADYHLLPGSPAIDAGANQGVIFDLEGLTRPFGGGFDTGAYEYQSLLWLYIPAAFSQE
jgi:parallel beta-helix repeat protein